MTQPVLPGAPATLPDLTPVPDEPWCVCHTRPRCEKKFSELLRAEQLVHYLPLVMSVRRYGTHTKRFQKPLFPGYVFARFRPELRPRLFQQELLARFLPVEDEPKFLQQLAAVHRIMASGVETYLHPLLQRGTAVRVMAGPLRGLEGLIDDPTNPRGIVLSVDVLKQGLLVKIPLEDLKLLAR